MNAEQIEKWAKQAGMRVGRDAVTGGMVGIAHGHSLTRFAELVAAAEREQCALVAENYPRADPDTCDQIAAAIRNTASRSGG